MNSELEISSGIHTLYSHMEFTHCIRILNSSHIEFAPGIIHTLNHSHLESFTSWIHILNHSHVASFKCWIIHMLNSHLEFRVVSAHANIVPVQFFPSAIFTPTRTIACAFLYTTIVTIRSRTLRCLISRIFLCRGCPSCRFRRSLWDDLNCHLIWLH